MAIGNLISFDIETPLSESELAMMPPLMRVLHFRERKGNDNPFGSLLFLCCPRFVRRAHEVC